MSTPVTPARLFLRDQRSPRAGLCSTHTPVATKTSWVRGRQLFVRKPDGLWNSDGGRHVAMTGSGDEDPPSRCWPSRSHRLRARSPSGHTSRHRQPDTESSSGHPAFPHQPSGKAGWIFCCSLGCSQLPSERSLPLASAREAVPESLSRGRHLPANESCFPLSASHLHTSPAIGAHGIYPQLRRGDQSRAPGKRAPEL